MFNPLTVVAAIIRFVEPITRKVQTAVIYDSDFFVHLAEVQGFLGENNLIQNSSSLMGRILDLSEIKKAFSQMSDIDTATSFKEILDVFARRAHAVEIHRVFYASLPERKFECPEADVLLFKEYEFLGKPKTIRRSYEVVAQ